jgi:hypothetical protein
MAHETLWLTEWAFSDDELQQPACRHRGLRAIIR